MRFPYQRTTGTLLREAFRVQRAQSSARNLGLSSITKGEGSIDLLPSDTSTTPEAMFGNLPDGSMGVGARINGQMVNLATWSKNRTDQLQSALNTEKSRNDSQDTIIANHTGRLDSHASRIGAVENAVGNAASTGDIATLNSRILTLNSQVQDLRERVRVLEARADAGGLPVAGPGN